MTDSPPKPGDAAPPEPLADSRNRTASPGSFVRTAIEGALKVAGSLASILLFFLWLPSAIDTAIWEPRRPLQLPAPRSLLDGSDLVPAPGPSEHLLLEPDGTLYTTLENGAVYRTDPARRRSDLLAELDGRPLGLALHPILGLLVANHPRGLQRLAPAGVETLATEADGEPIEFANAVAVAPDGSVYFTDSNTLFNLAHGYTPPFGAYDMLEMRPRGRLLRYDPATGETAVILRGLHFPNGLAFSRDGRTLYLAETFRSRVLAIDPATGEVSIFIPSLPGFPDNLAVDPKTGLLWVAMGVQRSEWSDWLQRGRFFRGQLAKLPIALWRRPSPRPLVLAFNGRGQLQHALEDPAGTLGILTSAVPHGDWLYLGSLDDAPFVRVPKPR